MDFVFALTAGVSIGAGLLAVTRRNPVHSAVWLMLCFAAFAVVFIRLDAPFLAAMHVLIYTGAILVLFLFVIMLLNLKPEEFGEEMPWQGRGLLAALCAGLFVLLAVPMAMLGDGAERPPGFGSVEHVANALFAGYVLPFELLSVLILTAVFGGVILAKRKS